MLRWAKKQLADVAGTEEPIYGPQAIRPVTVQSPAWTELTKNDLKWRIQDGTNAEVFAFYFTTDEGHLALAQVLYSNILGIRKSGQLNSKIIYPNRSKPHLWTTDTVDDYGFSQDRFNFTSKNVNITLSPDGNTYNIKSTVSKTVTIDATVTRLAPGCVAGKDGVSSYGTDPNKPWGTIRHGFWPRCRASGTMKLKDGTSVNLSGKALMIYALQGMKPHHGAASWDFADFHGPTYSAVSMAFTTPASYGHTRVVVGVIATDSEIVYAGADCRAERLQLKYDPESKLDEPTAYRFVWGKPGSDGSGVLEGIWGPRADRVDIMDQVPSVVKSIVANTVGTRPYIYQYVPQAQLSVRHKGQEVKEQGMLFGEATFITTVPIDVAKV